MLLRMIELKLSMGIASCVHPEPWLDSWTLRVRAFFINKTKKVNYWFIKVVFPMARICKRIVF